MMSKGFIPLLHFLPLPLLLHFFLPSLLIFGTTGHAQETGVIRFQVDNENGYFEILLNDTLVIKQYRDTLPVGTYEAKAWSPGYEVKDFRFTISANESTDAYVKLDRSTAYQAYSQSYKSYRMKFHKAVTLPVSASLAVGITGTIFMIKAYDLQKEIKLNMDAYYQSSNTLEIENIKASINADNNRYNRMRTGFYVCAGLTGLGVITTVYTGLRFRNNVAEPVYSKQSPFADKMSLQFNPYGCALVIRIG